MKKADIDCFFAELARINPAPRTELEYENVFTLLVAVVLSAQATDKGVNQATPALFAAASTPEAMIALGEERLRDFIKTIGLYNSKAKNVIALSKKLVEEYGGEVPANRDILETLPGVGRKTANVVMNEAFGEPTIAVDTHVFRVANRTGLARGKTPLAVEKNLEKAVPARWKKSAHHWLILHGRYTCLARKPRCWICVVRECCPFKEKTPDPATAPKSKTGRKLAPPAAKGRKKAAKASSRKTAAPTKE